MCEINIFFLGMFAQRALGYKVTLLKFLCIKIEFSLFSNYQKFSFVRVGIKVYDLIIVQENLGHSINYLPWVYLLVCDTYSLLSAYSSVSLSSVALGYRGL